MDGPRFIAVLVNPNSYLLSIVALRFNIIEINSLTKVSPQYSL